MNPQELSALQAIDATIMQLQALKLSLMTAYEVVEVGAEEDTPSGECSHAKARFIETMGRQVSICPDCDEQFEVN